LNVENDQEMVRIVQTTYLLDGSVLESDPVDILPKGYQDLQCQVRDDPWIATTFDVDGEFVMVPRERVNYLKFSVVGGSDVS
jgi:hypothetical protein